MRPAKKMSRLPLSVFAAGVAAGLSGCPDYTTGQDQEPDGPLLISRLTLFDASSRDVPVFTDTSIPDCSLPQNEDSRTCKNDINRDNYSPKKSPPTPDSGREVRVVFNKLPLYIGSQELERRVEQPGKAPTFELTDAAVVEISCSGCTGVPPIKRTLILSGSDTTSDPTYPGSHPANIPYGPAILVEVTPDAMRPFAALEPETAYSVQVKSGLAGRNRQTLQLGSNQQASMLTITTERFQVLRVGIGDAAADAWVYGKSDSSGPASHAIKALAADGVLQVILNAPIDESALSAMSATATVGGANVPLKLGTNQLVMKDGKPRCDAGKRRALYLFPVGGSWGAGEARVVIKGADLRDLSQAPGHPVGQGRHVLRGDLTLTATLIGKADDKYKGLTVTKVSATADCPQ